MKETEEFLNTFRHLGCNWNLTEDWFQRLEKFVSYIFGQGNVFSFNAARFIIFQTTGKFDSILPPCQNSLWFHAKRAN